MRERLRLRIYDPRNGPVQIGYVSGGFRSGEDDYVPASEVERLREALETIVTNKRLGHIEIVDIAEAALNGKESR